MLVRIATIKTSTKSKCWRGYGERGILLSGWWERKLGQPHGEQYGGLSKKQKTELPCDPATPLLGVCLKNSNKKTHVPRVRCSMIHNSQDTEAV